ncbi:unnamed protein product [Arabidopsis arenosa]|uniref:SAUR family protein n=1 Tax=Arabidopsis arenosa TaxID=38785 RepID=A0A8S1ZIB7_ARAAE|nr:unnamed protein product [Arabidopsis arenosa]
MAIFGKLTKLKSALKKWPSLTKNHHSTISTAAPEVSKCEDLHVVYVGKSRRPYMLSSHVISHPLFQELRDRSTRFTEEHHDQETVVLLACEVVLFEHLLWTLKNSSSDHGDDDDHERGSVEELAEFYTY